MCLCVCECVCGLSIEFSHIYWAQHASSSMPCVFFGFLYVLMYINAHMCVCNICLRKSQEVRSCGDFSCKHTHPHARVCHKVSACKLVSLLWADRVDKPFMRGINKGALPPPNTLRAFKLKTSNLILN